MDSEGSNSVSDQPTGIKFTYGIPGRDASKNRIDMPPRPTSNAPRGGGRGYTRGRGQSYGFVSQHCDRGYAPAPTRGGPNRGVPNRGGQVRGMPNRGSRGAPVPLFRNPIPRAPPQNFTIQPPFKLIGTYKANPINSNNNYLRQSKPHDSNNNNNDTKTPALGGCGVCDRPCTNIVCKSCGYQGKNLRTKKECPLHPKVIRVQDLQVCPECKTDNLEEKAEIEKNPQTENAETETSSEVEKTEAEVKPSETTGST